MVAGLAIAFCLAGCERGCAKEWLAARELGPATGGALPTAVPCPAEMFRCVGGSVFTMRQPKERCTSPEGCPCQWIEVIRCDAGCVAEAVELAFDDWTRGSQLCAVPVPTTSVLPTLPPPDSGEPICDVERFRCDRGVVFECQPSPVGAVARSVAGCVRGCAEEGVVVAGEVTLAQAVMLVCGR